VKAIAFFISFLIIGLTTQPFVSTIMHMEKANLGMDSCCGHQEEAHVETNSCEEGKDCEFHDVLNGQHCQECENNLECENTKGDEKQSHHNCVNCDGGHCTCSACAIIVLMHPDVEFIFQPSETGTGFSFFSNSYMFTLPFNFFHPPVIG